MTDYYAASELLRSRRRTTTTVSSTGHAAVELGTASAPDGRPGLWFEVDLADAVAYWHPGQRSNRALPPDWLPPTVTSLVESAPMGALYSADGHVLLGLGRCRSRRRAVRPLRGLRGAQDLRRPHHAGVPAGSGSAGAPRSVGGSADRHHPEVARWMSDQCAGRPRTPPAIAREPIYSTWYTFAQDIDAALVVSEARLAVELGCGSVFIDDGWQQHGRDRGYQGCGDWLPDESKFEDLADTVHTIHVMAPPSPYGPRHCCSERTAPPSRTSPLSTALGTEPPLPRARPAAPTGPRPRGGYLPASRPGLRRRPAQDRLPGPSHGLPGPTARRGHRRRRPRHGDLLAEIRDRLADARRDDVAFEFRQPYVSPAVARYGEILRANDCPGDSPVNRITTLDARLVSVGQVVHATR